MPTACALSVNHSTGAAVAAGPSLPPADPPVEPEPHPTVPSTSRLAALHRAMRAPILLPAFRADRRAADPGRLRRGDAVVVLFIGERRGGVGSRNVARS